jgi:hypothetical protein
MLADVTALAIYAGVVATIGVGWQVYSWRRDRTTRLRVELEPGAVENIGGGWRPVAAITLVNKSQHASRVTQVGFEPQSGRGILAVFPSQLIAGAGSIPATIEPHDSTTVMLPIELLEGSEVDTHRPLVAWARAGDGTRARSRPATLQSS